MTGTTPAHMARAVEPIARGALPMDQLATHVLPLEDIHRAYELMQGGESRRAVLRRDL